ncbi:MAG: oligosaccharide flippase family protein [Gemmatimonadaceae bacterium]
MLHERRLSFLRNTSALFGAQAVSMIVPLVTVPYLARVLRPHGWAEVILAQALGAWLVLLLEFAFDLSGTRAVAHARNEPESLPAVVAAIQGAKLLLVPVAVLITLAVFFTLPVLKDRGALLIWTLVFAIARGLNPLWFFQGLERMQGPVFIDAASKALAALGVFFFVASPADGWKVIALQGVFALGSLVVLSLLMRRAVPYVMPSMEASLARLAAGMGLFGVRAASGIYIQANTLILASLTGATTVAFFGGAERIVRASINLLQPLTQAFLPRLSFLSVATPARALRVIELCMLAIGGLGLVFGATAFLGATQLANLLLGPGYAPAIPILRALAPLPVLVAINTVLGVYWAVPFGHERQYFRAVIAAGATNVVLALLLVPRWGGLGMATAVVGAECTMSLWLGMLFTRRRHVLVIREQAVAS